MAGWMKFWNGLGTFVLMTGAATAQSLTVDVRPSGEALENAQNLQQQLHDEWAWRLEDCSEDPIRISSSEDGYLVHSDSESGLTSGLEVPARKRSTYRLLDSKGSRLRLSLDGESRLDADGKPIVWELVMLSPDSFCWRQTDWPEDGCTAALVRCSTAAPIAPRTMQLD